MTTTSLAIAAVLLAAVAGAGEAPSGAVTLSPADRMFCGTNSIVAVLPPTLPLKRHGAWSPPLIEAASSLVQRDAQDQPIVVRGIVELLQPFEEGFRIKLPDGEVRHNGETFGFRIWAYFTADAARKLSTVVAGDVVVLAGTMRRADIRLYDGDPWPSLSVDIGETSIYVDPEKAPAER